MANTLIGYRVYGNVNGDYVHFNPNSEFGPGHYTDMAEPEPLPLADAYRRLAGFIDELSARGTSVDPRDFRVIPVHRQYTPVEKASRELGGLLEALCSRHGLDLGLSRDQMESQIAKELTELGAGGKSFIVTGIPRIGR